MGSYLYYKGKFIGDMRPLNEFLTKWALIVDGLESLETLLQLKSEDKLTFCGETISYQKFKNREMTDVKAIFTSFEDYIRYAPQRYNP
jgi:hypothetical protein